MTTPRTKVVTNVEVADLIKVGGQTVRDMLLLVCDEGGCCMDAITGELHDLGRGDHEIGDVLFHRKGQVALILGYGQNKDGSGCVPGLTSIVTEEHEFKVIFAAEGFCIASIHESPGLTDGDGRKVPDGLLDVYSEILQPPPRAEDSSFTIVELNDIRLYNVVKLGERYVQDTIAVRSRGDILFLNRFSGEWLDYEAEDCGVRGMLFERDGAAALILGWGLRDMIVPGESSIVQDGKRYKIVFAMEGFSLATIHQASN
jgi:hypothetical protein